MSTFRRAKDLDSAIIAVCRSRAAMPDLFRELTKGELWFLMDYHPELDEGCLELKEGSPLPFAILEDGQGAVVPLFSSEARLDEGLEKGHVPPRTYSAGAMPARQVLQILGKANLRAILNKFCATGNVVIPPDLMRDLADGKALTPHPVGGTEQGALKLLDPADYPTNLIQPVFECLRLHKNFRAAWVFGLPEAEPGRTKRGGYHIMLLMEPRDDAVLHDLNVTVQAARPKTTEVNVGLLDETDASCVARMFREATPFYVAVDYKRPSQKPGRKSKPAG